MGDLVCLGREVRWSGGAVVWGNPRRPVLEYVKTIRYVEIVPGSVPEMQRTKCKEILWCTRLRYVSSIEKSRWCLRVGETCVWLWTIESLLESLQRDVLECVGTVQSPNRRIWKLEFSTDCDESLEKEKARDTQASCAFQPRL